MKYCPKCGGKPKCRRIIYGSEPNKMNFSVIGYVCSKCGHVWKPGEGKEMKRKAEMVQGSVHIR